MKTPDSPFRGADVPSYEVLINCMHCGLCLPTCPTYALTGLEKSSPRGRIRLIKAVADGELGISESFIKEMNFCLDCQACETACPAGVKYGSLVEAARTQIYRGGYEGWFTGTVKNILLNWTFLEQRRLKLLARLIRLYEWSGLQWFFQKTGLLRFISRKIDRVQPLSPSISAKFSSEILAETITAGRTPRYRVGFLTGCIMDVAFADVNVDTVNLLRHLECDVVVPPGQACCGSLQAHNGMQDAAKKMARHNIALFDREDLDFIVLNSAGCGAYMKEYGHLFAEDPAWAVQAQRVSSKVRDLTEFLAETGYRPMRSAKQELSAASRHDGSSAGPSLRGKRITYHDACHLVHTQKISREPRDLIRSIKGVEYVELPESTWCCGSAGIYNVVHYDDSMKLLRRKMENIAGIRPDIIVTGNPGCMLQIQYGLRRHGIEAQVLHTATFLWRACELA